MKKLSLVLALLVCFSASSVRAELTPAEITVPILDFKPVAAISFTHKVKIKALMAWLRKGTSMLMVLKLLSGPNVISMEAETGKEKWSYQGVWGVKLANPLEESIILMDQPGKRIKKKPQSNLHIVFDSKDQIERVWFEIFAQNVKRAKKPKVNN